jgi:hypothetical protein
MGMREVQIMVLCLCSAYHQAPGNTGCGLCSPHVWKNNKALGLTPLTVLVHLHLPVCDSTNSQFVRDKSPFSHPGRQGWVLGTYLNSLFLKSKIWIIGSKFLVLNPNGDWTLCGSFGQLLVAIQSKNGLDFFGWNTRDIHVWVLLVNASLSSCHQLWTPSLSQDLN